MKVDYRTAQIAARDHDLFGHRFRIEWCPTCQEEALSEDVRDDEFEPCDHRPDWHLQLDAGLIEKMVAAGLAEPCEYRLTPLGERSLFDYATRAIEEAK